MMAMVVTPFVKERVCRDSRNARGHTPHCAEAVGMPAAHAT
jgi:hypothetical protein